MSDYKIPQIYKTEHFKFLIGEDDLKANTARMHAQEIFELWVKENCIKMECYKDSRYKDWTAHQTPYEFLDTHRTLALPPQPKAKRWPWS